MITDSAMGDPGEIIAYAYEPNCSKQKLLQVCANMSAAITAIPKRYRSGYSQLLCGFAIADTLLLLAAFLPDGHIVPHEIEQAFICPFSESVIYKCDATALVSWIDQNPTERLPKNVGMIDMIAMEGGAAVFANEAMPSLNMTA